MGDELINWNRREFLGASAQVAVLGTAMAAPNDAAAVKEPAGLYAQHLAEEGFITLAYDASYQGESGGQPRLMEVPAPRPTPSSGARK